MPEYSEEKLMSRINVRSNVITAVPSPTTISASQGAVSLTITVDQVGGSVDIDTDHRTVLNPPTGSWPYTLQFPSGQGTSATINLTVNGVQASVSPSIRACSSLLNIADPSDWQAQTSVLVNPNTE